jgi:hypothetical protein
MINASHGKLEIQSFYIQRGYQVLVEVDTTVIPMVSKHTDVYYASVISHSIFLALFILDFWWLCFATHHICK